MVLQPPLLQLEWLLFDRGGGFQLSQISTVIFS